MLRYAIAGCGYVSGLHFKALTQTADVRIVALADRHEDLRAKAAEAYDVPQTFESLEAMLDAAEFDVLVLLTPTQFHLEHGLLAADCCRAVLMEKPLAPSVAECRQLIDAYRASGSRLGVLHSSRHLGHARWARESFADGTLGRPLGIDFLIYHPRENHGRHDPRFWRYNPGARGHGICINNLCHWTDTSRAVLGREPLRVHAIVQNLLSEGIVPEDSAVATILFEDGVVVTWRFITGEPECGSDLTITFYGSRGRIISRDVWSGTAEMWLGKERRVLSADSGAAAPWQMMHGRFARAIADGTELPIPPEDGLAAVRVSEAVYQSAATGQAIDLRE